MSLLRKRSHSTSTLVTIGLIICAGMFLKQACCSVLPVLGHGEKTNLTSFPFSDEIDFYCSHDRTWVDERFFEIRQCYVAIMYMLNEESDDPTRPNIERKNFISRSAPEHVRSQDSVLTPRKYVARKRSLRVFNLPCVGHLSSCCLALTTIAQYRRMHSCSPDAFRCSAGGSPKRRRTLFDCERHFLLR